MIQAIVSLYRSAIVFIFLVGLALSAVLIFTGGWGILVGVVLIGGIVMSVGISAVLLSMNDHLAAIRASSGLGDLQRSEHTQSRRSGPLVAAFLAIAVIVTIALADGMLTNTESQAPIVSTPPSSLQPGSSLKDGCVPELAAKVGLKCRE